MSVVKRIKGQIAEALEILNTTSIKESVMNMKSHIKKVKPLVSTPKPVSEPGSCRPTGV